MSLLSFQSVTYGVGTPVKGDKVRRKTSEQLKINRDPVFTRFETPFGLEEHHFNWLWLSTAHVFGMSAIFLMLFGYVGMNTIPFEIFYGYIGGLGASAACHRYWSHKSFKAKMPLQVLMMIMQTISAQYPIHKWCLEHRMHHKFLDTNADPYNAKRGFWYSHVGWLLLPRHPDFIEKRKRFDMKDLENDPVVKFQSTWYWTIMFTFTIALPTAFIYYYYELPLIYAIAVNYRRYIGNLHLTWLVNSAAHKWGDKPYDRNISPVNNSLISCLAVGEGWHNYHHTFPWDYKASEFGWKFNLSTVFIDFFAWLGWATELKTVSQKMLNARIRRTGDLAVAEWKANTNDKESKKRVDHTVWGWGDDKISDEFKSLTKILEPNGILRN